MVEFVGTHAQAFLTLFGVVCGVVFVLALGIVVLLVDRSTNKKILKDREETIENTYTVNGRMEVDLKLAKEREEEALRECEKALEKMQYALEENRRLASYLEGVFGALSMARNPPGQRDFLPFVKALAAWASDEDARGNAVLRDCLVRQALRIACSERLVTPELLDQLPQRIIEMPARTMLAELLGFGTQGNQIILRALGNNSNFSNAEVVQ